jgi:hypothetical protein
MAETALVESQVADSIELLRRLDAGGNGPTLAVWYFYEDVERWRLILAGPTFDGLLPKNEAFAYRGLAEEIASASLKSLSISDVKLVLTTSPLAISLRPLLRTPPNAVVRGRFVNTTLNGIFIKEMLILRSSA